MKCARARELISDYLDGLLPVGVVQEMDIHTQACPDCSRAVDDMRSMLQSLGTLSTRKGCPDCWQGVRSAILKIDQEKRGSFSFLTRPVAWVPACALGVFLVLMILLPLRVHESLPQNPAPTAELASYVAEHSKLQRQHPLNDPDVTFITAELVSASYTNGSSGR